MKFNEIPAHFDEAADGRKTALARTLREYGGFFGDASEAAISTGFRLAGALPGEGPAANRAATCREIADLLDADLLDTGEDRAGAIAAWTALIDGFAAAASAAPEDARGRYAAILRTLRYEAAAF